MRQIALLLALALTFAGCADDADDSDDGNDGNDGMDGMDHGEGGAMTDPTTWYAEVADNEFPDGTITIHVGDTVQWNMTGGNPHTVTSDIFDSHPDCNSFTDDLLGNCMVNGDTFSFTFEEAGEVPYFCKIHGNSMSATITVVEAM